MRRLVCLVTVLALPLVALVGLAGCQRPASAPAARLEEGTTAGMRDKILHHHWWKAKPTAAELDRLVALIRSQQANGCVWVDDSGKTFVLGGKVPYEGEESLRKAGLSARRFDIDMGQWTTRPTESDVLVTLVANLEVLDFQPEPRHGP